ncbi:MAG: hypothetical protein IIC02_07710, partial [Planctomycetes bacterium]|nr:hypothetical protein [Planctomycetota bacterium]
MNGTAPVPSMAFGSGDPGTTNTATHSITVSFGETEPVSFVQGNITLTNGTISGFDAASNPTFTCNLNATTDGAVTAAIDASAMTDGVGLANSATAQVSFTYDNTEPAPSLSFDGGNPGTTNT